jgi:hypothetical protein
LIRAWALRRPMMLAAVLRLVIHLIIANASFFTAIYLILGT